MKTWLKITAGAIALAAAGTVAYRRAADKLQFSIGGYSPNADGSFTIAIKVFNPSMFAYPVPTAAAKFFYNQKYLGFGRSTSWQKIAANGESILYVILQPDLTAFSEVFLTTLLTGSIPTGITYSGTIYLGRYMMPFESSYSIGKVYDTTTIRNGSRVDKYWTDNDIESKYLGRKQEIQPYLIDTQTAVQYFNLQGIEFGNWMNQSERLNFMFATLCTLQDMAKVLGISPSKMGLAQRLQLCFGSRGNGGNAAAFYQRTPYALINLTKTNGAGTFAHEFGHAIDEHLYFSEYGKTGMATGDGAGLAIRLNDFKKGSIGYLFELLFSILYYKDNGEPTQFLIDQKGRTEYYKRRREVWARTFEKYIYLKFKELGIKNTWAVVDDGATPPKDLVLKAEPIIFEIIKTAFGNTAAMLPVKEIVAPEIMPNKNVKASVTQAVKDITHLYPLSEMEIGILYGTFKDADIVEWDKPGLKKTILDKLVDKGFIATNVNGWNDTDTYKIRNSAIPILKSVEGRLQTLRTKKSGSNLFPEIQGFLR